MASEISIWLAKAWQYMSTTVIQTLGQVNISSRSQNGYTYGKVRLNQCLMSLLN